MTPSKTLTIEPKPADPQQHCAQDNKGDIVRSVIQLASAVAASLAQDQRIGKSAESGSSVHDGSAGEIECAQPVQPARGVPVPARDWIVYNRGPDEDKEDAR